MNISPKRIIETLILLRTHVCINKSREKMYATPRNSWGRPSFYYTDGFRVTFWGNLNLAVRLSVLFFLFNPQVAIFVFGLIQLIIGGNYRTGTIYHIQEFDQSHIQFYCNVWIIKFFFCLIKTTTDQLCF